ncbi:hypothetical protein PRZ48_009468 [Zasmidium cellare]|uniref:Uncharacterized protein n=1 Tax=Zasmidium cellare TaxID=395010 RepID=A0ABR0EBU1_ZASCE|nr:hypothetical protein PRZ48_009468 [Zasmidium cellare]
MCQLCAVKDLISKDRWPKPLETQKKDIAFLVDTIHDEFQTYEKLKSNSSSSPPPESLLEPLRMLSQTFDVLEADREAWWSSPEKRALRQRLERECEQRKLSDLHKINNTATSSIEALSAKLGQFTKWSLGMKGGMWELENASKVAKG